MKRIGLVLNLFFLAAFVIAGCATAKEPEPKMEKEKMSEVTATPEKMMEKPTEDIMMEKPTEDRMIENPTAEGMVAEAPAWFSYEFSDAASGEIFRIADFKDKVVLVETMAQWCSNCLKQQNEVKKLHDALGERDDLIIVGIDIDTNENLEALKGYVAKNGFGWKYSVATEELTREISNLYGAQFLNPPSTPMLIIDREGKVHPLPFGIKSAADLQKMIVSYLDGSM